jgi:dihydroflavonol-4-reductase
MRVLVTGATGLVGSTTCRLAAGRGMAVRALVRGGDVEPLRALGAEIVEGDLADPPSLRRAADGVDAVVHTAAILGGTWASADPAAYFAVNHAGSLHVLDAARDAGAVAVLMSTYAIYPWDRTITERSAPKPVDPGHSAYVRAKLAVYHAALSRAASGEQDVRLVVPGCIYGPSLFADRALADPTSFTTALLRALRGELEAYVRMPQPWSYAEDVALVALAALERGRSGASYLALGRAEEAVSLAAFANRAAALAGIPHRVEDVDPADGRGRFGVMAAYAAGPIASPLFDASGTASELGVVARPLDDGLEATVAWLRAEGRLDG